MRPPPLGLGRRGLIHSDDAIVFILIAGGSRRSPMARRDERIAQGARCCADLARSADLPEYALRTTLRMFAAILASLVFTFIIATSAAKSRSGARSHPAARHPPVGPDAGVSLLHGTSSWAFSRPRARRRVRGDLRDLHSPGLEHGVQLLPVAAHRSVRPRRGRAQFQFSGGSVSGGSRCRSRCPGSSGTR